MGIAAAMPTTIHSKRAFVIPEGVTVDVASRAVTVKGTRGTLSMNFKHIQADVYIDKATNEFTVEVWGAKGKTLAVVRSIISHTLNMITGVTKGFQYKLHCVYSHFPININITKERIELRNFLGEKRVRVVEFPPGISCKKDDSTKDQITSRATPSRMSAACPRSSTSSA